MTGNNFLNDGKEETDAGRAAAKAGSSITDCPYPKGSFASYDWIIGWYEQDRLKQDRTGTSDDMLRHVQRYFLTRRFGPELATMWMARGGDTGESESIIKKAEDDAEIAVAAVASYTEKTENHMIELTPIEKAMTWERMSGERLSDAERQRILDGGDFSIRKMT